MHSEGLIREQWTRRMQCTMKNWTKLIHMDNGQEFSFSFDIAMRKTEIAECRDEKKFLSKWNRATDDVDDDDRARKISHQFSFIKFESKTEWGMPMWQFFPTLYFVPSTVWVFWTMNVFFTITWCLGGTFLAGRQIIANNKWSNTMNSLLQIQNMLNNIMWQKWNKWIHHLKSTECIANT